MERESDQLGFGDLELSRRPGRMPSWFAELDRVVDWSAVRAALAPLRCRERGRPGHPPLMLFKALLLQSWYGLSFEALEEMLGDRLSFQRFCGLRVGDPVPDHMALWRFHRALQESGLDGRLFALVQGWLDAHGLIVRSGTLIDASIIQGGAARPAWGTAPEAAVDPDARHARKGRASVYGYKLHVAVDQGSGLIRALAVTPANVNDCIVGPTLVQGDEAAVLADQGYCSAAMRARIAATRAEDLVMRRPNRHHPRLPPAALDRNRRIARLRAPVERVFAALKGTLGLARTRCRGLAANTTTLCLACLTLNLRRACSLIQARTLPAAG